MDAKTPMGQVIQQQFDQRSYWTYYPTDYDPKKSYPLLLMMDGHTLFFDELTPFGQSWRLQDIFDQYHIHYIIVGIDCLHEGYDRLDEYCPYPTRYTYHGHRIQPHGQAFSNWILNTWIPYLRSQFTISKWLVAGASMGGLIALYLFQTSTQFQGCLAFSPSFECNFQPFFTPYPNHANTLVYLDFGEREFNRRIKNVRIRQLQQLKTHLESYHIHVVTHWVPDGQHNEASWSKAFQYICEKKMLDR